MPRRDRTGTTRTFVIGLATILVVAGIARSVALDADPPAGVSRDFSLTTDAGWYAAAALDRTVGRESDATAAYDRPLYTLYLRAVFATLGPSYAAMNAASIPFALLAVLFTALAARRLHGDAAGLLAGLFLAWSHAYLVFNRSAMPYTALTAIVAFAIWTLCDARRPRRGLVAAGLAILLGTLLVKEVLVLALPLLVCRAEVLELVRRRPWRFAITAMATLLVVTTVAFAGGFAASIAQKLTDYVLVANGDSLGMRLLHLESRSGIFHALPITLPLALLLPLSRRLRRREVPLLVFVVGALLALAIAAYSPLRYLLVVFPAVAILAAGAVTRLPSSAERPRPRAFSCVALGLVIYFAYQLATAAWPRPEDASAGLVPALPPEATLWSLLLFAGLLLALLVFCLRDRIAPSRDPRIGRVFAIVLAAAALVIDLGRTGLAHAETRRSVKAAMHTLDAVVSKEAVLSGAFAHTLTTETGHGRRLFPAVRFGNGLLRREYDRRGITHLILEDGPHLEEVLRRFAADDATLVPVHTFLVRGTRLVLLRFAHVEASYPLSGYERAVDEARSGDHAAAIARIVSRLEPESATRNPATPIAEPREAIEQPPALDVPQPGEAPLKSLLAECLLATARPERALAAAFDALSLDPYDARALSIAVRILLETEAPDAQRLDEAAALLRWLSTLDPSAIEVSRMLARVEADQRVRTRMAGGTR